MTNSVYYANCVTGLGQVTACELRRRFDDVQIGRVAKAHVAFQYSGTVGDLLALRTAEYIAARIGGLDDLALTSDGLRQIERFMRSADIAPAMEAYSRLYELPHEPQFRITASRMGDHEYNSQQIAAAAGAGIVDQTGWPVDLEQPDIDIRMQVTEHSLVTGIRLTPDEFGDRAHLHGVASLRPTIASAMCLLSEPHSGEVFLDPMCGTGTILAERRALQDEPALLEGVDRRQRSHDRAEGPARRGIDGAGGDKTTLIGCDTDVDVLTGARNAFETGPAPEHLLQAGATQLPICDGAIDTIVTNPPWGRRMSSHRQNRKLYPKFLRQFQRVVRRDGVMIILSLERRLMMRIIDDIAALELQSRTLVDIGGLKPSIYKLRCS